VDDIRSRLLARKVEQAEATYRDRLVEKLVAQAAMTYPPQLVSDTLDDMVEEVRGRIKRQNEMSLEDALRLEGRTVEQFREELLPQAERRLKQSLALSEFAEKEHVTVNDDEVVQEFGNLLRSMGINDPDQKVELNSDLGRGLRSSVLGRKVMQRLAMIGRGELDQEAELQDETADEAEA